MSVSGAGHSSRLRDALAVPFLCMLALVVFALAAALLVIVLVGIALLIEGIVSWLHPVDLASAWARTLAGIGLIGAGAALAALGWRALEGMAGMPGVTRLPLRILRPAAEGEIALHRARKFVAIVGILLALICLPFAAGIHANAHEPWLGWGGSGQQRIICLSGNRAVACTVSQARSS